MRLLSVFAALFLAISQRFLANLQTLGAIATTVSRRGLVFVGGQTRRSSRKTKEKH